MLVLFLTVGAVYADGVLEEPYQKDLREAAREASADAIYQKKVAEIQKNADANREMARKLGRYFKIDVEGAKPTDAMLGKTISVDANNPVELHGAYTDINADAQSKIAQQKEALRERQKQQEAKSKIVGESDDELANKLLLFKPYSYKFDTRSNVQRMSASDALELAKKRYQVSLDQLDNMIQIAKQNLQEGKPARIVIHDTATQMGVRFVPVENEESLQALKNADLKIIEEKYNQTVAEIQRHAKAVNHVQDYYRRAKTALEKNETALYPRAHGKSVERVSNFRDLHQSAQQDLQQLQERHKRQMRDLTK